MLFYSARDGDYDIFVMNADGSGQTNLTNRPGLDIDARSWSRDGSKIFFESNVTGEWQIYVMDADGSNLTQLTNNEFIFEGHHQWSPDGRKIAFASNRDTPGTPRGGPPPPRPRTREVYVMDANGARQTRLTFHAASGSAGVAGPRWSPDGGMIAFSSGRNGNREIYVMDTDGCNQTNITVNSAVDGSYRCAPAAAATTPSPTPSPTATPTAGPGLR